MRFHEILAVALVWFAFFFVLQLAFGADPGFPPPTPSDWVTLLTQARDFIASQATGKAGLIAGCLLLSQGLFAIFRTKFGDMLGIHKIAVLAVLSLITTAGATLLTGDGTWTTRLTTILNDGTTLLTAQVFLNQVLKQWGKRAEDATASIPTALSLQDQPTDGGVKDTIIKSKASLD